MTSPHPHSPPIHWMKRAIALSEQARFQAPPNPWVGAIIVKNEQIIGEGYTQSPGKSHAEICALEQAGNRAEGADLYVTLEPCAHIGRTPPCTKAIIASGIKKVYIGVQDPDKKVNGKGIALLNQAGIETEIGICAEEISSSLASYLYQRRTALPYTIIKTAISIDGRTAAADGTSKWITGEKAREDVHLQRSASQAIVIGAGTALTDSPKLTARHPIAIIQEQPLRVLLDAKGKVPAKGALFDSCLAKTLVVSTKNCPLERIREWEKTGAEVIFVSPSPVGVDLLETWRALGERSILQVLVEGGPKLHTSLLQTDLFQRLLVYVGPLLLGQLGHPLYNKEIATLSKAIHLSLQSVLQLEDTVRLDYV